MVERHRDKEVLRARLADLCRAHPEVAKAIDAEVDAVNNDPDALDELLREQNFRLAYWRTGAEELSYRRFFDIETLAGLRVEDETTFADTHRLILDLVADGSVDGLRVDHVDGLADPEGYLIRLRDATSGAYVVVEKILEADEELPATWPVAGTSGYEFLNHVGELFVDAGNEAAMRACYARFTGLQQDYADVVHAAKLQIMREELAAEVERLTGLLADVCERHRRHRDHTRRELREALREIIAAFGVYRTYFRAGHPATRADLAHVAEAVATATRRCPDHDAELLHFIGDLITRTYPGEEETGFAVRFPQVSAPVMAKGVEDTAFYRYQPLISLNEVGGDPSRFGGAPAEFHQAMAHAARRWPETMLTLSTHDTKRSGDVRARISVLSELPGAWESAVGPLGGAKQRAQAGRLAGPQRRVPALPDPGRRLADRCGAGRRVHAEGDQGSKGAHLLGRPGCGLRRRVVRVRDARSSTTAPSPPTWKVSWPSTGSSSAAGSTPWPRPR